MGRALLIINLLTKTLTSFWKLLLNIELCAAICCALSKTTGLELDGDEIDGENGVGFFM